MRATALSQEVRPRVERSLSLKGMDVFGHHGTDGAQLNAANMKVLHVALIVRTMAAQ